MISNVSMHAGTDSGPRQKSCSKHSQLDGVAATHLYLSCEIIRAAIYAASTRVTAYVPACLWVSDQARWPGHDSQ
jgi:hypothetical protein